MWPISTRVNKPENHYLYCWIAVVTHLTCGLRSTIGAKRGARAGAATLLYSEAQSTLPSGGI